MGPLPINPTAINPILHEIDQAHAQLSPPAQQAIAMAGATPPKPMVAAPAAPALAPIAAPTPMQGLGPDPASIAAHRDERNRLLSTGSGISQIHNPVGRNTLRVLDAIGTGLFPGIAMGLPGTEAHHNLLVRQANNTVNQDEKLIGDESARQHTAAETAELGQRGAEEAARAQSLLNPQTKENPNAAKTLETAEGIMQFNPQTGRYDIPVGKAPGKDTANVHVLPDGTVVAVNHDPKSGKSTAEVVYKGEPGIQTEVIDQAVNGKPHNVLINKKTGEMLKDLGEKGSKPSTQDFGTNVIDPESGTLVRLHPGQKVPEGAQTPTQFGSQNTVTTATRTMAEKAPRVLNFVDRIGQLLDENEKQLGPLQSRWREFTAGKIGVPDKGYTQLRTDLGLLHTALMNMHVGARGGERIMEHFQDLIDGSKQSPENLRAALGEIKLYAQEVEKEAKRGGSSKEGEKQEKPQGTQLPGGITMDEVNAEIERRKKAKGK